MKNMKNQTKKIIFYGILLTLFVSTVDAQYLSPTKLTLDYTLSHADTNLRPGDSGVLTVVIKNVGGQKAERVEVFIPDTGDIKISKREYLGTMNVGDVKTISTKYTISQNAKIGLQTIKVNAVYDGYDAYGKEERDKRDSWEMTLKVKGDSVFAVENVETDRTPNPGDTVALKIKIRNKGIGTAYDTEASLTLGISNNLIKVLGAEKQYIGDIETESAREITYTIYLDRNLPTGAYSLPLIISYKDRDHTLNSVTLPVGLQVTGETRFSLTILKTDPNEIHAGDEDVEITVKVDNSGTTELKNLKIVYLPVEPFENSKSYEQSRDFGTLKAGTSSTATFYANVREGAEPKRTMQKFFVSYEVDGRDYNTTVNIPVDILDYPDFELTSESSSARINEKGELRIKVVNKGSKCNSVTVWALKKSDQPFDFEDKSQYVGDLSKGESGYAVLSYTVEKDAKVTEYILPIEVRCTKDEKVLVFSRSARIKVEAARYDNTLTYVLGAVAIAAILFFAYTKTRKK